MTQAEIRGYFEVEARELADTLAHGVAGLAGGEPTTAALRTLERAAHTLKGAAHVVGENALAALAHRFEDALTSWRAGPTAPALGALVGLADAIAAALSPAPPAAGELSPATVQPDLAARPDAGAHPVSAGRVAAQPAEAAGPLRTVRIDLHDAERLLAHIDEGAALVTALRAQFDTLRSDGPVRDTIADTLDRLDRELGELHGLGLQLRLLPLEGLLLEAGRTVRATAARLGRQARLVTGGGHERVRPALHEALREALLHLLRNALSHGIEPPSERGAQGKPVEGIIEVLATRGPRGLCLICRDDGRGIAPEPLRRTAVARGAMTAEQAAAAGYAELLSLLLRPGFSTQEQVNDVAGRGVGLDAVQAAMERVGGTVEIQSEPGRGTCFLLRAPQREAAVALLEVTVAGMRCAVPADAVEQTLLLQTHQNNSDGAAAVALATVTNGTLRMGQETMTHLALSDYLSVSTDSTQAKPGHGAGLVVRADTGVAAVLGVDRVEGRYERLVTPLPGAARAASFVMGAALGPQGRPMLIIDAKALQGLPAGTASAGSMAAQTQRQRAPILPILVIDDSLTTRMLEQSILEAEGYEVELAGSAEQGLALARSKPYALFLVDVEMPGMNGFEFVATVTADPALRGTPAILVTSLNTPEHRERGRAAGAYSYIVKGEFNQQVYLDRIRGVVGGARAGMGGAR